MTSRHHIHRGGHLNIGLFINCNTHNDMTFVKILSSLISIGIISCIQTFLHIHSLSYWKCTGTGFYVGMQCVMWLVFVLGHDCWPSALQDITSVGGWFSRCSDLSDPAPHQSDKEPCLVTMEQSQEPQSWAAKRREAENRDSRSQEPESQQPVTCLCLTW